MLPTKQYKIPVMKTSHVYWFAYFDMQEPSVRYRAKYALDELQKHHGVSYDLVIPSYRPINVVRFVRVYMSILLNRKDKSVIVYEKIRTKWVYATALKLLLKLRNKRTIYDIDDADYIKYAPETIHFFMKHSEGCTVGSSALAEYCRKLNKDVCVLTSPVVEHGYVKGNRNKRLTIGWVGYYNAHKESLKELLFPALAKLEIELDFVVMGINKPEQIKELHAYFAAYKHVNIVLPEAIDWQNERAVYKRISDFDIGVAPLLSTPVNNAKSAFKLKQYLCCGVPVLGSSVGENSTFLVDGYNGYSCNDANDYVQYIQSIVGMSDVAYSHMSKNALKTCKKFDMTHYCSTLLEYMGR